MKIQSEKKLSGTSLRELIEAKCNEEIEDLTYEWMFLKIAHHPEEEIKKAKKALDDAKLKCSKEFSMRRMSRWQKLTADRLLKQNQSRSWISSRRSQLLEISTIAPPTFAKANDLPDKDPNPKVETITETIKDECSSETNPLIQELWVAYDFTKATNPGSEEEKEAKKAYDKEYTKCREEAIAKMGGGEKISSRRRRLYEVLTIVPPTFPIERHLPLRKPTPKEITIPKAVENECSSVINPLIQQLWITQDFTKLTNPGSTEEKEAKKAYAEAYDKCRREAIAKMNGGIQIASRRRRLTTFQASKLRNLRSKFHK